MDWRPPRQDEKERANRVFGGGNDRVLVLDRAEAQHALRGIELPKPGFVIEGAVVYCTFVGTDDDPASQKS